MAAFAPGYVWQLAPELFREVIMVALLILAGLLIGLIIFDIAALRWGVDSSTDVARSDTEWQERWRGAHGD